MEWVKKEISPEKVKNISVKYNCDLLTASILARRGIVNGEEIKFFLEKDELFLHNPFDLSGMEDAVDRILAAKEEGEKVLIFGDSDVDGITGTVLLTRYLASLGMDISWRIPGKDDPYGLSLEAVEKFANEYGTLIITVDCGISRIGEIKRAGELSVDVIVTDHHEPQEQLPEALVIINPKLKNSAYPFKDISGCTVAFKLVQALRFALSNELYSQEMCLLNARPVNDAYIIEIAKMRNLSLTATLSETIIPGMVSITETRLPAFLQGQQIFVWDAQLQKKIFTKLFGNSIEIEMADAAVFIGEAITSVAGKSLIRIRELSAAAKYYEKEMSELDVFVSLFRSFVKKKYNQTVDIYEMQLAALGTIGDIMPLLNENRIIVRSGVNTITQVDTVPANAQIKPGPGIAELLDKLELSGSRFNVRDIAWKVCPVINAARRIGDPEKAAALFFEKERAAREKIAGELVAMNEQRKMMEEEIWHIVEPMGNKSFEDFNNKMAFVYGSEINRGVTGLIAQRLVRRFNVPSVAVSFNDDVYTGSIRSARAYNINGLLEQCRDLFIDSGGHEFAGGFSMQKAHWEAFTERLKTVAFSIEFYQEDEGKRLNIDAELPAEFLNPDILNIVDSFAPYGKENETIIFLAKKLLVEEINFIGKNESKHLRMVLAAGKHKWPALYWDAAVRVINKEFSKGDYVDVACNFTRDWYRGIATPQMMILDLRKSA